MVTGSARFLRCDAMRHLGHICSVVSCRRKTVNVTQARTKIFDKGVAKMQSQARRKQLYLIKKEKGGVGGGGGRKGWQTGRPWGGGGRVRSHPSHPSSSEESVTQVIRGRDLAVLPPWPRRPLPPTVAARGWSHSAPSEPRSRAGKPCPAWDGVGVGLKDDKSINIWHYNIFKKASGEGGGGGGRQRGGGSVVYWCGCSSLTLRTRRVFDSDRRP